MARSSNYSGPKYANGNYKSYQKKYDSSALQISKRSALNKENRKRGTYGNGDGKDVSHKKMERHSSKQHQKTEHVKDAHDTTTSYP